MDHKRKRSAPSQPNHDLSQARLDPTYGQRSFFPGLDRPSDSGAASAEALAYLRSVRTEASGIPNLLTAPDDGLHPNKYGPSRGDFRGYYEDGAYVASALVEEVLDSKHGVESVSIHPGEACHAFLIRRFKTTRAQLLRSPPSSVSSTALDPKSRPISVDLDQRRSDEFARWDRIMTGTTPSPLQLASMDPDTVQWLLASLPEGMKRSRWKAAEGEKGKCVSAWIWGLLARLEDLDTLSSEEVSVVRDLGKRAGALVFGTDVSQLAMADVQGSDIGDTELEMDTTSGQEETTADHDVEAGNGLLNFEPPAISSPNSDRIRGRSTLGSSPLKRRRNSSSSIESEDGTHANGQSLRPGSSSAVKSKQSLPNATKQIACSPEDHMIATLDMVLTIVGEVYGQRDLLVARDKLWENPM